ncbi:MAG: site-2 protease family protein [Patescibacteria group bacterium]
MSVLIFIIVLAVLILVHELGHFLAAKSAGVRVDEFGLGFPPKVVSWKPENSETTYSLNWIPFGGFVKIVGEDGEEGVVSDPRNMMAKGPLTKIWLLSAGVIFNFLLAWALISTSFMTGLPTSVTPETAGVIGTPTTTLIEVISGSVAADAGLTAGDEIAYIELPQSTDRIENPTVEEVQEFVGARAGEPFTLGYRRLDVITAVEIIPRENVETGRGVIGVGLDFVGLVKLPPHVAVAEGLRTTGELTWAIAVGLIHFIGDAVTGAADFSQVAGPVGIAGLVGDAASRGIVALLSFTALISLNLAVLNLLPFPALDGGRILFVIIETIKGTPIKAKTAQVVNTIGFGFLILLMLVVTISDIVKLF